MTDKTMSGTITQQSGLWLPCLIMGQTSKPTVVIIGDSRTYSSGDTISSDKPGGDAGYVRPLLYQKAFLDFSRGGTETSHYNAAATTKRRSISNSVNFTHLFNGLGVNNIYNSSMSSATLLAAQQQIKVDWGNKPMAIVTLDPYTTSSDGFATVANQTLVNSTQNTQRVAYNTAVRASPVWALAVFDVAGITESSLNSGKWNASYTTDGLHANHLGYTSLINANVINPIVFSI
jgi:lysophospholipase L1-like esterase